MGGDYPIIDHPYSQNIYCAWCGYNIMTPTIYGDQELKSQLVQAHKQSCSFRAYYQEKKYLTPKGLEEGEFGDQLMNYLDTQVALRDMHNNREDHDPRKPRETQKEVMNIILENEIQFVPRKLFTKIVSSKMMGQWKNKETRGSAIRNQLAQLESYGLILRRIKINAEKGSNNYKSFLVFDLDAIQSYLN